ncbi:hypothetical protein GCHA_1456 [Paraglaciecola chathamensis S18K6]|uniref:Uncharacterized protein n=1 Tax=Paraglaciecola chathamensis S18K6 TaxID=1127672 RepID=A0AAV3UWM0_9ALTE|nr:hypothetical protein GCHA_1456 [Paraglaciecola chathamensis S18K6]
MNARVAYFYKERISFNAFSLLTLLANVMSSAQMAVLHA